MAHRCFSRQATSRGLPTSTYHVAFTRELTAPATPELDFDSDTHSSLDSSLSNFCDTNALYSSIVASSHVSGRASRRSFSRNRIGRTQKQFAGVAHAVNSLRGVRNQSVGVDQMAESLDLVCPATGDDSQLKRPISFGEQQAGGFNVEEYEICISQFRHLHGSVRGSLSDSTKLLRQIGWPSLLFTLPGSGYHSRRSSILSWS